MNLHYSVTLSISRSTSRLYLILFQNHLPPRSQLPHQASLSLGPPRGDAILVNLDHSTLHLSFTLLRQAPFSISVNLDLSFILPRQAPFPISSNLLSHRPLYPSNPRRCFPILVNLMVHISFQSLSLIAVLPSYLIVHKSFPLSITVIAVLILFHSP